MRWKWGGVETESKEENDFAAPAERREITRYACPLC